MTKQEALDLLKDRAFMKCAMDLCDMDCQDCYEALYMAIEALRQEPIIQCEECKHHGTSNCPMWGDDTTEDYMWCCYGEKRENNE